MKRKILLIIWHVFAVLVIAYVFVSLSFDDSTIFMKAYLGDRTYQTKLADYYEKKGDKESAMKWLEKSASGGNCQGYHDLALKLAYNEKIDQAVIILEKCARIGCTYCGRLLTEAYSTGELFANYSHDSKKNKIDIDIEKSARWAEITLYKNNFPSSGDDKYNQHKAFYLCGLVNFHGYNGKKNLPKALECFEKAVNISKELKGQHLEYEDSIILGILGHLYVYGGDGIEKNISKGAQYFLSEKKENIYESIKLLFNGIGVEKNVSEAKALAGNKQLLKYLNFPAEKNHELYTCNLKDHNPLYNDFTIEITKKLDDIFIEYVIKGQKDSPKVEIIEKKKEKMSLSEFMEFHSFLDSINFFNIPSESHIKPFYSIKKSQNPLIFMFAIKEGQIQIIQHMPYDDERPGEEFCMKLFQIAGIEYPRGGK